MQLNAIQIPDPRPSPKLVGVVPFYYPGYPEWSDRLCGCGFLGNFWDLQQYKDHNGECLSLELEAPICRNAARTFANAEAAFQALKFWRSHAEDFQHRNGEQAVRLKNSLRGREDFTYGGFGSNWNAMYEVLRCKFSHEPLRRLLLDTKDTFLLEHNPVGGRDAIWSDNHDGSGTNWLGLQLMLLRDEIGGQCAWSDFFKEECGIDVATGEAGDPKWQRLVQCATKAVTRTQSELTNDCAAPPASSSAGSRIKSTMLSLWARTKRYVLGAVTCFRNISSADLEGREYIGFDDSESRAPVCIRAGCGRPTWNGQPNEYCSRTCRVQGGAPLPQSRC